MRDVASLRELLNRYDRPGPRYTSYPTAVEFHEGVTDSVYRERLAAADVRRDQPLSFYIHSPFCEARCSFCGCNVIITRHREVEQKYLDYLEREIDLLASQLPNRRRLSQLHWGGGTPTYHTPQDLARIVNRITSHFSFTPDAEVGIEIDPRVTSHEQLTALRGLGFNRLSLGVQDFAPDVQAAVHRIQSYDLTRGIIEHGRALGFSSINVDLIYGLPYQTADGFARTLDQVLTLRPDRVAAYSFAFVPWIRAHMKHLPEEALPSADVKVSLLAQTIEAFTAAGYRHIGMDHFALPEDELAKAIEKRTLNRNFMGYTVQSSRDMVAVGISGIGDVQGTFVQNTKKLPSYYGALDAGQFPIERGYSLDADDEIRRHVISELMCNSHLDIPDVERRFGIAFDRYFAAEIDELAGADDLAQSSGRTIDLTDTGRLFVRNVCMIFDRYLRARTASAQPVFSRTV